MRWAARSRAAFVARPGYGQFGIVQGGVYPDLRAESAAALRGIGFEGYAIGGLAIGEGQETTLAGPGRDRAASSRGSPALPDGRRHAERPRAVRAARRGHVRLRDADARRAHGAGVRARRARSTCATPSTRTIPARSSLAAPVPLASGTRAPTFTICSRRARCSDRCSSPGTTSRITSASWPGCGTAIVQGRAREHAATVLARLAPKEAA